MPFFYSTPFRFLLMLALLRSGAAQGGRTMVVRTLAGGGFSPISARFGVLGYGDRQFEGVGTSAFFNSPTYVAVDSNGTVLLADTGNNRIRKVTPSGLVTTLAGRSWYNDWSVVMCNEGGLSDEWCYKY